MDVDESQAFADLLKDRVNQFKDTCWKMSRLQLLQASEKYYLISSHLILSYLFIYLFILIQILF